MSRASPEEIREDREIATLEALERIAASLEELVKIQQLRQILQK